MDRHHSVAKRSVAGSLAAAALVAAGMAMTPAPARAQQEPAASSHVAADERQRDLDRLLDAGRYVEAEPLARQIHAAAEGAFGADDPRTAFSLNNLAEVLRHLSRLGEAEELYRRVLAIQEIALPEDHPDLATAFNNVAEVVRLLGRLDEAEALHRRALAIYERALPADDPDVGASLNNLAGVLRDQGRLDEAEQIFRQALAIREQALPADDPQIALSLTNLAVVLQHLSRTEEAERLHRRALAIYEAALPENHPDIATSLNNLAGALSDLGRAEEAERMHRRALALRERTLPAGHPDIAISLSNLASTVQNLGRYDEAEALDRRALAIYEAALPDNHPDTAAVLNNLAMVLQRQERFEEAAGFHVRALAIREQALPADHPQIAASLSNLASALQNLGQQDVAEDMHRRALAIQERALPEAHPEIAQGIENLAIFLGAWQQEYEEALLLLNDSTQILTARHNRATVAYRGWRERAFFRNAFGEAIWLRHGMEGVDVMRTARRNAFLDLQWERTGGAGGAIAVAMARAQADPDVATLARARDRALAGISRLDDMFLSISSDAEIDRDVRARRLLELRAEAEGERERLAEVDAEIARRFPAYAELAEGLPVPAGQLMSLLGPDEVLVSITPFGEHGLFFAYGHDGGLYSSLPGGTETAKLARKLRCSAAGRLDPACTGPGTPVAAAGGAQPQDAGGAEAVRGAAALSRRPEAVSDDFDLDLAHDLYNRLFPEKTRDFLRGKKLIIAPAPELMGLPWHLLVAEAPPQGWNAPGADRAAAYREARWLFREHPAISVLPAAASLRALRSAAPARAAADLAFLGVGDPVIGRNAAERAAAPMECGQSRPETVAAVPADALARATAADPAALFSELRDEDGFALADPDLVRRQPRLADTRCEIEAVAASLGVAEDTSDLLLGADATEARIRELDESGALARYRILHFATHGLLGGELGLGEPGLVLTPPHEASARDDGILTAGEIATLTLAADWVVLSACNTAAGSEADAEALSGLARSFFYAGAKSLLVSSWPVYSDAAVKITTRAFEAMRDDPSLGRAEALNLAMRDVLASARSEFTAHPAYWAPFFLVGEGAG